MRPGVGATAGLRRPLAFIAFAGFHKPGFSTYKRSLMAVV
jgi:hypothetical protein